MITNHHNERLIDYFAEELDAINNISRPKTWMVHANITVESRMPLDIGSAVLRIGSARVVDIVLSQVIIKISENELLNF